MLKITGRYNTAIVYTDLIDSTAQEQLKTLCDQPFIENCSIRIMPDVHAGTGCVIGFTADLGELVIPSIVGVDIGCGMLTVELGTAPINCQKLDKVIRRFVPAGQAVHKIPAVDFPELSQLLCYKSLVNLERMENSLGTLGGGNHFIEVDVDDEGNHYLVIHTGSRYLGKQVAEYYRELAWDTLFGKINEEEQRRAMIARYKAEGRTSELEQALKNFQMELQENVLPKSLCYLTGENRAAYLHDMKICQEYAAVNRATIAGLILQNLLGVTLNDLPHFETIHNYIDHESNIIRKGAVSAKLGEQLLIPINMRDGSLLCVGKGNPDWNCSAPHGAGRLYSRGAAREKFSVEAFRESMTSIYTTSVAESTLDECPMAYKPMESIVENIAPTAEIIKVIRPVYNFKAGT